MLRKPQGEITLETYVVSFNREEHPVHAILIGLNDQGDRVFAMNDTDIDLMRWMTVEEPIGKRIVISNETTPLNRFTSID